MNQTLFNALKQTAEQINTISPKHGFYALRKVNAVSANSPLQTLVQVGEDLQVIAKVMKNEK